MSNDYLRQLELPVYDYTVVLYITDNINETKRAVLRDEKIIDDSPEWSDRADGLCINLSDKHTSVVILGPKSDAGTVAHEVIHAVENMFTLFGVPMSGENLAYHLGYITNAVVDSIICWRHKYEYGNSDTGETKRSTKQTQRRSPRTGKGRAGRRGNSGRTVPTSTEVRNSKASTDRENESTIVANQGGA